MLRSRLSTADYHVVELDPLNRKEIQVVAVYRGRYQMRVLIPYWADFGWISTPPHVMRGNFGIFVGKGHQTLILLEQKHLS
jgi:hypothetical protein